MAKDPRVNVSFLDPAAGQWASVFGTASVVDDRDQVRKYYSPALKNWFGDLGNGTNDGGPNDPRIGIIKVHAESVAYAIVEPGMLGKDVCTLLLVHRNVTRGGNNGADDVYTAGVKLRRSPGRYAED